FSVRSNTAKRPAPRLATSVGAPSQSASDSPIRRSGPTAVAGTPPAATSASVCDSSRMRMSAESRRAAPSASRAAPRGLDASAPQPAGPQATTSARATARRVRIELPAERVPQAVPVRAAGTPHPLLECNGPGTSVSLAPGPGRPAGRCVGAFLRRRHADDGKPGAPDAGAGVVYFHSPGSARVQRLERGDREAVAKGVGAADRLLAGRTGRDERFDLSGLHVLERAGDVLVSRDAPRRPGRPLHALRTRRPLRARRALRAEGELDVLVRAARGRETGLLDPVDGAAARHVAGVQLVVRGEAQGEERRGESERQRDGGEEWA